MAGRKPTVDDDEILQVFRDASDPFLSTSEVASKLSIGRKGTLKRLKELEEEGELALKKVGRASAWWIPDNQSEGSDDIHNS